MNNPCLGDDDFPNGCRPTYSYRHVVSLTDNEEAFNVSSTYWVIQVYAHVCCMHAAMYN